MLDERRIQLLPPHRVSQSKTVGQMQKRCETIVEMIGAVTSKDAVLCFRARANRRLEISLNA